MLRIYAFFLFIFILFPWGVFRKLVGKSPFSSKQDPGTSTWDKSPQIGIVKPCGQQE